MSGGQKQLESDYLASHAGKSERDAKAFSENSLYLGDSLCDGVKHFADRCENVVRYDSVTDKHGKTRGLTVMCGV